MNANDLDCQVTEKIISITILKLDSDNAWRVVVFIDGVEIERSPPFESRSDALRQAQQVAKRLEAKFARLALQ